MRPGLRLVVALRKSRPLRKDTDPITKYQHRAFRSQLTGSRLSRISLRDGGYLAGSWTTSHKGSFSAHRVERSARNVFEGKVKISGRLRLAGVKYGRRQAGFRRSPCCVS